MEEVRDVLDEAAEVSVELPGEVSRDELVGDVTGGAEANKGVNLSVIEESDEHVIDERREDVVLFDVGKARSAERQQRSHRLSGEGRGGNR